MQLIVMSVFDAASSAYGRPIFVHSIGSAVRSFGDEIRRDSPDNEMFRHPGDFSLWRIGSFDDNSGELCGEVPNRVALGSDYSVKD